jgi:hypothetical protein
MNAPRIRRSEPAATTLAPIDHVEPGKRALDCPGELARHKLATDAHRIAERIGKRSPHFGEQMPVSEVHHRGLGETGR